MKLQELGRCARHAQIYFFQWALAPRLANAFVESRVLAEGVTICSQGHPLQRPNQNLAPKTLGFSFLPQNLRLTNVCAQPPPKKHTGHLFSTNFAKKAILWFCKFLCKNWPNWGVSLGMSQHVAACRWACRSMSLGMSQHVAACRGDFCARRWACRSMSQHVAPLLASVAGHVAAFRATFGRVATFRWGLGEFLAKISVFWPGQRPSVFFGQPARTNVRRFQCFLPKGNWAEGGGFYIATRVKRFFGSGTVTPGPSCECDITFLLMGGQNLGNNCVTVR